MSIESAHFLVGHLPSRAGAASAALRLRAAAWQAPLVEEPGRLTLELWGCRLELSDTGTGQRLALSGPERRLVDTLRDAATEIMEEAGLAVAWDRVDAGSLAPGLSLVRVAAITRRSPRFVRVRVEGPDLGRFGGDSLHFRLLIPPQARPPVWPRVAETGRTRWPEGADAPHRAVYTVAEHGDGWVAFDVFLHPGSPTCDWLDRGPCGETVGVLGPGGGGCPASDRLFLYGDETALPAISRMLAMTRGTASAVLRAHPDDMGAMADDPRARRGDDLLTALLADTPAPSPGGHVWFAGRADQARAARAHLLATGWGRQQITCAAYWDQAASAA